jgi:gamma-glutamylcyclotransferase (GGCT)/AIG2-like uncharacterized protein YtfP
MSLKKQHAVFIHGEMCVGSWKQCLMKDASFVGRGKTREKFARCLGAGGFFSSQDSLDQIEGDVYFIDQKSLDALDLMQGHPYWCFRKTVPIDMAGGAINAWLYLSQKNEARLRSQAPTWTIASIEDDVSVGAKSGAASLEVGTPPVPATEGATW